MSEMEDEQSEDTFYSNLTSMLEISLVETAESAAAEKGISENGNTTQNVPLNERGTPSPAAEITHEGETGGTFEDLGNSNTSLDLVNVNDEFLDLKFKATPNLSEEEQKAVYDNVFKDPSVVAHMRLHCTVCDCHIGCGEDASFRMNFHPVLRVLVCHDCQTFYGTGDFEVGEDGSETFCRWCGQGGQVFCCSHCPNVFCKKCIRRNFGKKTMQTIDDSNEWTCYLCDVRPLWNHRALCFALTNFLKDQSKDETKFPAEKAEKCPGFNDKLCCKGERIPYHRAGQPLRILHIPPSPEEILKRKEAIEALKEEARKKKEAEEEHKEEMKKMEGEEAQRVSVLFNTLTNNNVPASTNSSKPSLVSEFRVRNLETIMEDNKASTVHVFHNKPPVAVYQSARPTSVDPNPLNPLTPRPYTPVASPRFPAVNKIVLSNGNTGYTIANSSAVPVVNNFARPPGASYFLVRHNPYNAPRLVPIAPGSTPINIVGPIQQKAPPSTTPSRPPPTLTPSVINIDQPVSPVPLPTVSPNNSPAVPSVNNSKNQPENIELSSDDDEIVEVFNTEAQELSYHWMFKAFKNLDQVSRLLSYNAEVMKRKFSSEVRAKDATASIVRRFAGEYCCLLKKAIKKLSLEEESVNKLFSEWLSSERQKHGVNLQKDVEASPEKAEQKETDLLLDMDCESDHEDDQEAGSQDDLDSSCGFKQDLMACSDTLSDKESDYDPFTSIELVEKSSKIVAFKPFYSRTVREVLKDQYISKLFFKLLSEQHNKVVPSEEERTEASKGQTELKGPSEKKTEASDEQTELTGPSEKKTEASEERTELKGPSEKTEASKEEAGLKGPSEKTEASKEEAGLRSPSEEKTPASKVTAELKDSCEEKTETSKEKKGSSEEKKKEFSDASIQTEDKSQSRKEAWSNAFTSFLRAERETDVPSDSDSEKTECSNTMETAQSSISSKSECDNISEEDCTKKESSSVVTPSKKRKASEIDSKVKVVSRMKLEYTDVNSKPSTSKAAMTALRREQRLSKHSAVNRLHSSNLSPMSRVRLQRIDANLIESAMKKKLIKPCCVPIVKLI